MILSKVKNTFNKYRGLSTEEKPTNIPQHSSFLETDTGATYNYDGLQWNLEESGGSGGGSSGGGALYLTSSIIDDKIVLSASYNDVLAAIENNKAVFLVERLNGDNKGFSVLYSINAPTQVIPKYGVIFSALDELFTFAADTATEPLVFFEDVDDSEVH